MACASDVCRELQHVGAIGMVGRGAKREVMTPFGEYSEVCRTCGACAFVCPTGHIEDIGKISGKKPRPKLSEFNLGLTSRGNIYRTYPQAVPATPVIDPGNCIQFLTGDCGVCAQSCTAGAINYDQKAETISVDVGSVILAPGFKTFDPNKLEALGYHHPNVVTTLEFERILSPGGTVPGACAAPVRRPGARKRSPGFCAWAPGVNGRVAIVIARRSAA